jgi:hypothetical protein
MESQRLSLEQLTPRPLCTVPVVPMCIYYILTVFCICLRVTLVVGTTSCRRAEGRPGKYRTNSIKQVDEEERIVEHLKVVPNLVTMSYSYLFKYIIIGDTGTHITQQVFF